MIRVVGALLLAWEPFNFAVELLTVLPTIAYRGWLAALELACHAMVATLAASAGLALWNRTPSARPLATVAIVLSVTRTIQATWWSALPTTTTPGTEGLATAIALLVGTVAIVIVQFAGTSAAR